ncbi:MAG: aldo/keto reductase [Terrimicrobiaceae bacterium]|nr:aldo/keto reductase [Terrimicrobiaceae bacterium]
MPSSKRSKAASLTPAFGQEMNPGTKEGCSPLVVGGHSFIAELGNDPATGFDEQLSIVNECLDQGINTFDTTYEPERVALGRILESLGRRDEARVIAWNFFVDENTGDYFGGPQAFRETHIERLLSQVRTDCIDMLVVHPVLDDSKNREQIEIARSWVSSGHVRELGTWSPGNDPATQFGPQNPYDFIVTPRNIKTPHTEVFRSCKAIGCRTFATSPFNRGWLLDQLISTGIKQSSGKQEDLRARIADGLLRFAIHHPHVDHLIVGIRRKEWIDSNLESVRKGPLSEEERQWLFELLGQTEATGKRE